MPSATFPPTTHPDIPPFPSASTFSILPSLYLLLSRLAPLQNLPSDTDDTLFRLVPSNEPPLQTAEIVTAIYPIRQKIQKAVAAIKTLPDIDRSTSEQDEELLFLEARVKALQDRLGELGAIAEKSGRKERGGDVVMEGVEGEG